MNNQIQADRLLGIILSKYRSKISDSPLWYRSDAEMSIIIALIVIKPKSIISPYNDYSRLLINLIYFLIKNIHTNWIPITIRRFFLVLCIFGFFLKSSTIKGSIIVTGPVTGSHSIFDKFRQIISKYFNLK